MDEYFIASLVSNTVWVSINDLSDEEIAIKTIMFFVVRLIIYIYNLKKLKIDPEVLIVINFIIFAGFAKTIEISKQES